MTLSIVDSLKNHYTMWVLLGFSVLAIAVALERLIVLWGFIDKARHLTDTVSRCLSRGALQEGRSACERSPSPLADVFLVGYERHGRSKDTALYNAVHRERMRVTGGLKNRMWMLGTIGATAPFIGLFGTVVGIMVAMNKIRGAEGAVFTTVAPDIAQALYATAAGILVAVEAVVLYNYFNQRTAKMAMELKLLSDEFIEQLQDAEPAGDGDGDKESKDDGAREAA